MPNMTSSWYNLTSQTLGLTFNFTNPTHTDLTLISISFNLTDHSDGYPLGQITLTNPITVPANEKVTFQMTETMNAEAANHIATTYANASSFDADISNAYVDFAGIALQLNGTSTLNNITIVK